MKDFAKSIVCNVKAEVAKVGNYDPKDYENDPRHKWTIKSIENEIQKYKQRIELNRVRITQLRNMENSGSYPSSSRELKEEQKDYEANQMKVKQLVSMLRRATGNELPEDMVENSIVGNATDRNGKELKVGDMVAVKTSDPTLNHGRIVRISGDQISVDVTGEGDIWTTPARQAVKMGNSKVGNKNIHLNASNSGELDLSDDGTGSMYDPVELGRYDFSGKSEAMSVARELEQLKRKAEQKVKDADKFINAIKQWASGLK